MSSMYIKTSMKLLTQIITRQDKDALTLLPLPTAGPLLLVSTLQTVRPKMETATLPLAVPEVAVTLTHAQNPVAPGIQPSVICVQTSFVKAAIPTILVKVVSAKLMHPMMVMIVRVTMDIYACLFHPLRRNVAPVMVNAASVPTPQKTAMQLALSAKIRELFTDSCLTQVIMCIVLIIAQVVLPPHHNASNQALILLPLLHSIPMVHGSVDHYLQKLT